MSEQEQDLTPTMQELMAQMAQMRAELNSLKQRAGTLPQGQTPPKPVVSATRRNTLKRLGLALLGGLATATALGEAPAVQARIIVNPQGSLENKAGMVVALPGVAAPTGTALNGTYGLIASAATTAFDLSTLPIGENGVYGSGNSTGVYGSSYNTGVYGSCYNTQGISTGVGGTGYGSGVVGSGIGSGSIGVAGNGPIGGKFIGSRVGAIGNGDNSFIVTDNTVDTTFIGLVGNSGSDLSLTAISAGYHIGVYGRAPVGGTSYAGFFQGDINVTGTVYKGAVSFKIDHPVDPANKYLYHTCIESPDMMNIYNGLVTFNEQGEATVEMPGWFEALNSDYRYQLTCLGHYAPVYIAQEISDLKFKIAGGLAGQKVSWQVTGIRQDAYAKAHRIQVEEDKNESEKGKYLHPELFGQPEEMGIGPRATPAKAPV